MKQRDYQRACEIIRRVIADWQPFAWAPTDPNDDEFDGEIKAIAKQLPRVKTSRDAAEAICRVFRSSFDGMEWPVEKCTPPGEVLWQSLREAGLL